MVKSRPLVLLIMDGWGLQEGGRGNALSQAQLPCYRALWNQYPHAALQAAGEAVGLPEGQMGNSEVGHLNLGAGRVVYQELTRISRSIKEGSFSANQALQRVMEGVKQRGTQLHLMGLLSDGGVHSHLEHLWALLAMTDSYQLPKVAVHAFLDGRDVLPASAAQYLRQLEQQLQTMGRGRVASISGRYYAMDRDNRWERTEKAYRALVLGEGKKATMPMAGLESSYHLRITDEFVEPTVMVDAAGEPVATVRPGDAIIFFNFRADRARQLTQAFVEEQFDGFDRPGGRLGVQFVCFTQYEMGLEAEVAFLPQNLINTLGEVLSRQGVSQLRIAETEKYAHVTYFFNGGIEEPYPGEDRSLVPSPKVATYNLQPEMSAAEVTRRVVEDLDHLKHQVVIVNLANPDMVGHTGILPAAIQAVEMVDTCLAQMAAAVQRQDGILLVTADHGNVEQMVDYETGEAFTAHTAGPVPLIVVDDRLGQAHLHNGILADVAPTVLHLLGIPQPAEMTGRCLLDQESGVRNW